MAWPDQTACSGGWSALQHARDSDEAAGAGAGVRTAQPRPGRLAALALHTEVSCTPRALSMHPAAHGAAALAHRNVAVAAQSSRPAQTPGSAG
jgi:hypothetical protein